MSMQEKHFLFGVYSIPQKFDGYVKSSLIFLKNEGKENEELGMDNVGALLYL